MTNMCSSAGKVTRAKVYSEFTAQEIDGEVKRIIDERLQDRARIS